MNTTKRLMNCSALAEMLDVSLRTVEGWVARGAGPRPIRLPGGRMVRFDPDEVEAWISQR